MYKKRLKGNDIESGRSVIPRESDRSGQKGRAEGEKKKRNKAIGAFRPRASLVFQFECEGKSKVSDLTYSS